MRRVNGGGDCRRAWRRTDSTPPLQVRFLIPTSPRLCPCWSQFRRPTRRPWGLSSGVAAWHRWAALYRNRVQQVRVDEVGAAAGLFLKWRGWRTDEQDARRARTFKGEYRWVVNGFCPHSAARAITAAKPCDFPVCLVYGSYSAPVYRYRRRAQLAAHRLVHATCAATPSALCVEQSYRNIKCKYVCVDRAAPVHRVRSASSGSGSCGKLFVHITSISIHRYTWL
jgi:hypothetical protein